MSKSVAAIPVERVEQAIFLVRREKVILTLILQLFTGSQPLG